MGRKKFNLRVPKTLSISEKNVENNDLSKFFKKIEKLTKHYDFTKGFYSGEPNESQLYIYLIEKDFENIFGNSSHPNTIEYKFINLDELKEVFKEFKKNIRSYSKEQMLAKLRNMTIKFCKDLEIEFRRKINDAND